MKCILVFKSNKVIRVNDSAAIELVKSGAAKYVPKSLWKSSGKTYGGK